MCHHQTFSFSIYLTEEFHRLESEMQAEKMLPLCVWYFGGKIETLLINQYLK